MSQNTKKKVNINTNEIQTQTFDRTEKNSNDGLSDLSPDYKYNKPLLKHQYSTRIVEIENIEPIEQNGDLDQHDSYLVKEEEILKGASVCKTREKVDFGTTGQFFQNDQDKSPLKVFDDKMLDQILNDAAVDVERLNGSIMQEMVKNGQNMKLEPNIMYDP